MNGEQIERLLRNIKEFDGVFAIDNLPDNPRMLVCNLDPSHRSGSHWICICVNGTVGEHFDSLGRAPNLLLERERYMIAKCSKWTYNRRQLQSVLSAFCGHYCVYFCLLRNRGITMNNIVASFSSDIAFNDYYVHSFVCRNASK